MTGICCYWRNILLAGVVYREEGPRFSSYVHSSSFRIHNKLLLIFLGGNNLPWKVSFILVLVDNVNNFPKFNLNIGLRCWLQCARWDYDGWRPILCDMGKDQGEQMWTHNWRWKRKLRGQRNCITPSPALKACLRFHSHFTISPKWIQSKTCFLDIYLTWELEEPTYSDS